MNPVATPHSPGASTSRPARAGAHTGIAGRRLTDHRAWTTGGLGAAGAPALMLAPVLALVLRNHPAVGTVARVAGLVAAILSAAAGPAARHTDRTAAP
ncbi:hypothetical protein [Streptomyces sp. NPDC058307]|uniref:hypothetical protein n=1 Tax=Streptomyces sp. NPDC058307 TaxID=3346439 RepID=UPI0036E5BE2C